MAVKASYIILIILIFAVVGNIFFINKTVEEIYEISSEGTDDTVESLKIKFDKIQELYDKKELFISLSVSHDDLTDIETSLSEINGAIKAEDFKAAIIAKSRFENALLHLGRLSSLNIESIL